MQNFCFCQLSMQILWRRRCSRVVDLKLPISAPIDLDGRPNYFTRSGHIWPRGRLISPSLPVGDDWYLNLNSQKRPPGRNLGEHRLVRRSGTTSRGTIVFIFCLRMRSYSRTEVPTIFMGRNICEGSTKNLTPMTRFTHTT